MRVCCLAHGLTPAPPLLLLLLWARVSAGTLKVEMAERMQMVSLHDNVTIPCKIPGSPRLNITTMGIIWFRRNQTTGPEVTVFEFYGNHKAVFRSGAMVPLRRLERGDASLQLPGVQLWEAGEYRCKLVVTPQKAEGRSRLEVVARPATTLSVEQAIGRNNEDAHILCNSQGFFPENISIKWEKRAPQDLHFQNIADGFVTGATVKNEDGTFRVTSCLTVKPAVEASGTTYQCMVWHRSLHASQSFNVTLPTNAGSVMTGTWSWIALPYLLPVSIILMAFVPRNRCTSASISDAPV